MDTINPRCVPTWHIGHHLDRQQDRRCGWWASRMSMDSMVLWKGSEEGSVWMRLPWELFPKLNFRPLHFRESHCRQMWIHPAGADGMFHFVSGYPWSCLGQVQIPGWKAAEQFRLWWAAGGQHGSYWGLPNSGPGDGRWERLLLAPPWDGTFRFTYECVHKGLPMYIIHTRVVHLMVLVRSCDC